MNKKAGSLSDYMDPRAAAIVEEWMQRYPVQVRISRSRSSKLGDYRPPQNGYPHRISVNHDLNKYAFLITLVHEFAHLLTWEKHRGRVAPHGVAWKYHFRELMAPFLSGDIFPREVLQALTRYLHNPAAASCTDLDLLRTLRKYDQAPADLPAGRQGLQTVEELPPGSVFGFSKGRIFRKGDKLRKRFRCTELATGKIYLFSPLAKVSKVESSK